MAIIKVIAAVIVMAVLAATFFLVERLREESAEPQLGVVPEIPSGATLVKPGEIAFERAGELLATGQFAEAREKLVKTLVRGPHLRRVELVELSSLEAR